MTRVIRERVDDGIDEFGLNDSVILPSFSLNFFLKFSAENTTKIASHAAWFSASVLVLSLSYVWSRSLTAVNRFLGSVDRLAIRFVEVGAPRVVDEFICCSTTLTICESVALRAGFLPVAFPSPTCLLGAESFMIEKPIHRFPDRRSRNCF